MPTTFCVTEKITEKTTSPKVTSAGINTTMTRQYDINANGHSAALALLKATVLPYPTVDGILLNATPTLRIEPSLNPNGGVGVWSGQVEYRHPGRDEQTLGANELLEPFREKVSASFSGETQHITTAITQERFPGYGPNQAPRSNFAINVQSNGEVEGTEIYKRTGSFTVSTVLPESLVDNDWLKERFKQVWTINNANFRGWEAGEVALTSMDIRQRSDGNWEIDYSFQISPSQKNVGEYAGIDLFPAVDSDSTADGATTTFEGWNYVWVRYTAEEGDKWIEPKAIGVYEAQVYEYSDFSQLGILT
jgi:hypothetical protein